MSITIDEEKERLKANWNNQLFSFDFWLSLAKDAEKKINQYGDKLHKSSRLFADQLFDGYAALYLSHCLIQLISLHTMTWKMQDRRQQAGESIERYCPYISAGYKMKVVSPLDIFSSFYSTLLHSGKDAKTDIPNFYQFHLGLNLRFAKHSTYQY